MSNEISEEDKMIDQILNPPKKKKKKSTHKPKKRHFLGGEVHRLESQAKDGNPLAIDALPRYLKNRRSDE